jgi:hypothetical protein
MTRLGGDGGTGINSQNYETEFDTYDDEAADDFVVPEGVRWKITEVDMGGYYNEGPADSMGVYFNKDKHGRPGKDGRAIHRHPARLQWQRYLPSQSAQGRHVETRPLLALHSGQSVVQPVGSVVLGNVGGRDEQPRHVAQSRRRFRDRLHRVDRRDDLRALYPGRSHLRAEGQEQVSSGLKSARQLARRGYRFMSFLL